MCDGSVFGWSWRERENLRLILKKPPVSDFMPKRRLFVSRAMRLWQGDDGNHLNLGCFFVIADSVAVRLFGTIGIVIITKHLAHLIHQFKVGVGPK